MLIAPRRGQLAPKIHQASDLVRSPGAPSGIRINGRWHVHRLSGDAGHHRDAELLHLQLADGACGGWAQCGHFGMPLCECDGPVGNVSFDATHPPADLNGPIVGIAAYGSGYWLVGEDGGVFAYGNTFYGSAETLHLNAPVVGIASTPDGLGYYIVAADGGLLPLAMPSIRARWPDPRSLLRLSALP